MHQTEHPPLERWAVWASLCNCSQISSPSLVHNNGVRVNWEQERRAGGGGEGRGLWSNPPRPKQLQEGGEERREAAAAAAAAAASQPRVQPAWASPLASFSIVLRCSRGLFPPCAPLTGSCSTPPPGFKMMKFRFRRQGTDPQREKIKQELFAFNKVK